MTTETMAIGPIVENTILINETLSALLWELNGLNPKRAMGYHNELAQMGFVCDFAGACIPEQDEWPEGVTHDDLGEVQDEIIEYLQDHHIPPYCYLGTHEGDGASLGVWPDVESIEMAIQDGEILSFDDNGQALPEGYTGDAVYTNDHGNMTCGHVVNGEFVKTYWDCV
tara:strand:- start:1962 stop:2468 length:507 start_codon:yes stop_codon:yes gene_type:complete